MNFFGSLDASVNEHSLWNTKAIAALEATAASLGLGPVGTGRVLTAWLAAQSGIVQGAVLGAARDIAAESDDCDRSTLEGLGLEGIARLAGWDEYDLGEVLIEAASFVAFDKPSLDELEASLCMGAAALGRAPH